MQHMDVARSPLSRQRRNREYVELEESGAENFCCWWPSNVWQPRATQKDRSHTHRHTHIITIGARACKPMKRVQQHKTAHSRASRLARLNDWQFCCCCCCCRCRCCFYWCWCVALSDSETAHMFHWHIAAKRAKPAMACWDSVETTTRRNDRTTPWCRVCSMMIITATVKSLLTHRVAQSSECSVRTRETCKNIEYSTPFLRVGSAWVICMEIVAASVRARVQRAFFIWKP